jgi:hypothetical protein
MDCEYLSLHSDFIEDVKKSIPALTHSMREQLIYLSKGDTEDGSLKANSRI